MIMMATGFDSFQPYCKTLSKSIVKFSAVYSCVAYAGVCMENTMTHTQHLPWHLLECPWGSLIESSQHEYK